MNVYTLVAFVALCLLARLTNVTSIMCGRSNTAFTTTSHDREQEILASEKDVFPDDPYMNYLLWPHLHFSGTYIADVSTINNDPQNYNTEKVIPTNLDESSNNWNPKGTGEWSVNGVVTQICYPDGNCIDSDDEKSRGEPLVGALVFDGGNKSAAKLTDLDTEARLFSEIWGWRLRFGNFFSADYSPVPFQYMWKKMVNDPRLSHTYGGAYQSVLSNIRWIQNNNSGSPFLTKLQKSMESKNIDSSRLSIRLTMDMYQNDSTKNSFTTGRITGTIGLLGIKSPPFFTHGRMMRALSDQVQDAPFYVDKINKKVAVDFGNSLPIDEDGNMDTILKNKLLVAVHLDNNDQTKCSDNLIKLGVVLNKDANWYETSAGVQIFPDQGSLSDDAMSKLADHPLVVAEVNGNDCQRILLAEAQDGLVVHPYSKWTLREEPNETAHVQLLVTKFGNPLQNANIKFEPCNCEIIFSGPKVGLPPLPVERPEIMTNIDGIATFNINTKDPKNNRSFIDGQLYPFFYSLKGKDDTCDSLCVPDLAVFLKLLNKLIVIRVFDNYKQKGKEATWLDDVYPIFKQYANLYPVMADNFVDLGNYHEVVMYRRAIQGSLMLPIHHPNHMPASRDLSASKRQVIVKWLSNDSPAKGNPEHYYSVEHLRQDLQNALELEHSTIPPYLTALASIKFSYNLEVQGILKEIIIQEMMHMALVANILNAIGGQPSLYSKEFIPRYPSRLPGGVQPDLIVPIEKVSLGLIRNIFMKIEQPELEKGRVSSLRHTFAYAELLKIKQETQCHKDEKGEMCIDTGHKPVFPLVNIQTDHSVDDELSACFISPPEEKPSTDSTKQKEEDDKMLEKRKLWKNFLSASGAIVKHNNTIGGFYNHILNALGNLTGCGKHNDIFTGNRSRQVNVKHWSMKGHSLEVYDYITAVDAIKTIVEQGEGSSPCNPVAWNTEAGKSLSHYFLFRSVAEKREIRVWNKTKHKRSSGSDEDGTVLDYSELCNGTYHFIGPKIPFDPNGVWPIISNPTMARYSRDSKAHRQAKRFNQVYTKLLKSLDNVFNGQPDTLKDALGLMYSVDLHLKKLVHTPIADDGDPEVGPNAAPTFDFTP